jgi:hypothetical protein
MLKGVCHNHGDVLHHLPSLQIEFTHFLVLAQNEVFCSQSCFHNVLVVLLQDPGCLGYLPASTDCPWL